MSDPVSAQGRRRERWLAPELPENEIPSLVPVSAVLGRGPDAVLFLVAAAAYSSGVAFWVGLRVRHRLDSRRANVRSALVGMPLATASGENPEARLMVGVELADGRRAVMRPAMPPSGVRPSAGSGVVSLTGAFSFGAPGQLGLDTRYWLEPLPPPGPLQVVIRWFALGIEETVTELDGSALAAAAEQVVTLWPPTPPEIPPKATFPPPSSGWFAAPSTPTPPDPNHQTAGP